MNKEKFIEIYKTYSVEALSEMLHDHIMVYEKKADNLHKALRKKDEKIKNQANEISVLLSIKEDLENNEKTLYSLMVSGERRGAAKAIESINKMDDIHEKQMKVAESEIKRLNIIIHYLETKGL
jgi:hypothetical protein